MPSPDPRPQVSETACIFCGGRRDEHPTRTCDKFAMWSEPSSPLVDLAALPQEPRELIARLRALAHREGASEDDADAEAAWEDVPEVTWAEMREIVAVLVEAADALDRLAQLSVSSSVSPIQKDEEKDAGLLRSYGPSLPAEPEASSKLQALEIAVRNYAETLAAVEQERDRLRLLVNRNAAAAVTIAEASGWVYQVCRAPGCGAVATHNNGTFCEAHKQSPGEASGFQGSTE